MVTMGIAPVKALHYHHYYYYPQELADVGLAAARQAAHDDDQMRRAGLATRIADQVLHLGHLVDRSTHRGGVEVARRSVEFPRRPAIKRVG